MEKKMTSEGLIPIQDAIRLAEILNGIAHRIVDHVRTNSDNVSGVELARVATVGLFAEIQSQHVTALSYTIDNRLFASSKHLIRVIYEGVVRFAWLVRDSKTNADRLDRWTACALVEHYRFAADAKADPRRITELSDKASSAAKWITDTDWQAYRSFCENGDPPDDKPLKSLLSEVDAYEGKSFGELKTYFFDTAPEAMNPDLNKKMKAEYGFQSMYAHWGPYAVWRNVEGTQSNLEYTTPDNLSFLSGIALPCLLFYEAFLRDASTYLQLDLSSDFNCYRQEFADRINAHRHISSH